MAEKLNPEALEFFRKAGQRGGKKRVEKTTKKQRVESAKKAANARWAKQKESTK